MLSHPDDMTTMVLFITSASVLSVGDMGTGGS